MLLSALLYQRFTAARPDGGLGSGRRLSAQPSDAPTILRLLEAAHGLHGAREIAGVPRSTWNHIRAGRRAPAPRTRDKIRRALRALWMRNEDAYRTWPGIVIYARVRISRDDRTRCLNIGRWTDSFGRRYMDAVQDDVVTEWLRGNDSAASDLIERVVERVLDLEGGSFGHHITAYDIRWFRSQAAADTWANAQGSVTH